MSYIVSASTGTDCYGPYANTGDAMTQANNLADAYMVGLSDVTKQSNADTVVVVQTLSRPSTPFPGITLQNTIDTLLASWSVMQLQV
jgi:hypothetical protein